MTNILTNQTPFYNNNGIEKKNLSSLVLAGDDNPFIKLGLISGIPINEQLQHFIENCQATPNIPLEEKITQLMQYAMNTRGETTKKYHRSLEFEEDDSSLDKKDTHYSITLSYESKRLRFEGCISSAGQMLFPTFNMYAEFPIPDGSKIIVVDKGCDGTVNEVRTIGPDGKPIEHRKLGRELTRIYPLPDQDWSKFDDPLSLGGIVCEPIYEITNPREVSENSSRYNELITKLYKKLINQQEDY